MILIAIIILAALVFFGGSYYAYYIAFHSPKNSRGKIPSTSGALYDPYRPRMKEVWDQLVERPFETVTIRSKDGLSLSGRYYHIQDGAPLVIGFHGYRSHPLTDFSGGSELIFRMGYNLLLPDQRAHHSSEGRAISFGIQERWDVKSWAEYAVERFGSNVRILLMGISMGGATVLMASELPLPEQVRGIVSDCPYADPEAIILEVGKKEHYPSWLIRPFLHIGAKIYGAFTLCETNAVQAVKNTRLPILIIHGESDGFVPCSMSAEVQQANPKMVQRITIPGADHGISYLVDTPRYAAAVKDFIQKVLQ